MGIVADVVPNHMCIERPGQSVVVGRVGERPQFAVRAVLRYQLESAEEDLVNKVLLPILGDQYGRILEDQQITVCITNTATFFATVNQKPLPLAPRSWALVLEPAAAALKKRLGEGHEHVLELESILTALSHLAPPDETDAAKVPRAAARKGSHPQAADCAHGLQRRCRARS